MAIDEIRERAAAATPGPWGWHGSERWGPFLGTWNDPSLPGLSTVMGFERLGMQSAQPTFAVDHMLKKAVTDGLTVREVPYRRDIEDIDNPDARFIAHSRSDIDELLARVDELETEIIRLQRIEDGLKKIRSDIDFYGPVTLRREELDRIVNGEGR